MKTIEELEILLENIKWFSCVGKSVTCHEIEFEQLQNLDDWARVTGMLATESVPELIERGMEWLPSSRDMDDPIRGSLLDDHSQQLGKKEEHSRRTLKIYKKALVSLRGIDGLPAFQVGPSDFTEVARGTALFAVRRAAHEIILDNRGFWCSIMNLYKDGHWPCGILPDKTIVIF